MKVLPPVVHRGEVLLLPAMPLERTSPTPVNGGEVTRRSESERNKKKRKSREVRYCWRKKEKQGGTCREKEGAQTVCLHQESMLFSPSSLNASSNHHPVRDLLHGEKRRGRQKKGVRRRRISSNWWSAYWHALTARSSIWEFTGRFTRYGWTAVKRYEGGDKRQRKDSNLSVQIW